MEERHPEDGGGRGLRIEPECDRCGLRFPESEEQKDRPEDSAEEHREGETSALLRVTPERWRAATKAERKDANRRAQIEQSGEGEGTRSVEQDL